MLGSICQFDFGYIVLTLDPQPPCRRREKHPTKREPFLEAGAAASLFVSGKRSIALAEALIAAAERRLLLSGCRAWT